MEDVPVLACMEDVPVQAMEDVPVQACMETCMEDVLLQACMEDVPAQAMELESQACMEYVPVQAMELESQACMEYAMELESQACMEYVPVQAMELESQACMEVGPTQACMETCMEDVGLQACMEVGPTQACMEVVPVKAMGEQKNMHPQQFYELSKKIVSVQSQIMDQSDEVSLDVNELANSLREQLKINKAFSLVRCIYRVPERLRKLNEQAYTPRVVSIGPIHHGKENLKAMEDHKIMYLQQFLEQNLLVSVEDLVYVIKENEAVLRDCYAETISLSRKDFATMILLDAVFIIMVLLNWKYKSELYDSARLDHIFYRPFKFSDVVFDMCLLENQLPFFILEKFLELYSVAANPENCTLTELTCGLLKGPWSDWVKEDSWKIIDSSGVLHFVDFLRKCQQPKKQCRATKPNTFFEAPTATELHQSGMKFKNPKKGSLLDITFRKGILKIPQLKIEDSTEILFRNLQAFEQCHHRYMDNFVSNYITFISRLVRDPNDVKVLESEGNLKSLLNSEGAVSNLFYNLQKEIFVTDGYLSDVGERLKSHCSKPWHKWKPTLKQVYFNNPWTGISVFAATFLLILTVIQTVCSILQLR